MIVTASSSHLTMYDTQRIRDVDTLKYYGQAMFVEGSMIVVVV